MSSRQTPLNKHMLNSSLRCSEIIMSAYLMNLAATLRDQPALLGFIYLIMLSTSSVIEGAKNGIGKTSSECRCSGLACIH